MAFALSFELSRRVKDSQLALDSPNKRKTQVRPISRLGGVAIFLPIALYAALYGTATLSGLAHTHAPSEVPEQTTSTGIMTAGLIVLVVASQWVIGFLDDLRALPTGLKLGAQLIVFSVATYAGLQAIFVTPFGAITFGGVTILGSVAWLLVMTNSVNFMDGSNGLMAGSLAIMLAGLASVSADTLSHWLGLAVCIGAIAGFLCINLRGTLFAGDAGSLGLGSLFAALALASGAGIWSVATLALPFLLDVLMTLIWRARHGRPWLKPHRDHAYQRLIDVHGWSHFDVALLYWSMCVACASTAYIGAKAGGAAPFIAFWGLSLSGVVLWWSHRRRTQRDENS
ncbi:MAG: hypothetical protein AAGF20_09590 [Pseudomonadota bacterium]